MTWETVNRRTARGGCKHAPSAGEVEDADAGLGSVWLCPNCGKQWELTAMATNTTSGYIEWVEWEPAA
jgi:hypothetical protein